MSNAPQVIGLTVENAHARLTKAAIEIWDTDRHNFSTRPCTTCRVLSVIVGEDWGCLAKRRGTKAE